MLDDLVRKITPVFRHDTKYISTDVGETRHKGDINSLGDAPVGSTIRVIQGKAVTILPQTLEVQIEPPRGKYIHGEANRHIPKKDFTSLPDERRFDDIKVNVSDDGFLNLNFEEFSDIVTSLSKERAEAILRALRSTADGIPDNPFRAGDQSHVAEALALAADFRMSDLSLDARWQSTFQTKNDITREFRPLELNPEDKKGGIRVDKAKLASLDNNQYRGLIRTLIMRLIPKPEGKIKSYPSHS